MFLIFGAFYGHAVPWVLRVIGYNGMFLQDLPLLAGIVHTYFILAGLTLDSCWRRCPLKSG